MFDLRIFVKTGITESIGNEEDYKVVLRAAEWHARNVLTLTDLTEIDTLIEAKKTATIAAAQAEGTVMGV